MLNYKTAFELDTKRCKIRMIDIDDVDSFFELCSDELVCKYLTFEPYKTKQEANKVIQNMIRAYLLGECVNYAIISNESNKLIGSISLTFNQNNNRAELGYLLKSEYWNKKIMTEILDIFIDYSFDYYDLDAIKAITLVENEYSFKLLHKFGFKLVSIDNKKVKIKKKFVESYTFIKEK